MIALTLFADPRWWVFVAVGLGIVWQIERIHRRDRRR